MKLNILGSLSPFIIKSMESLPVVENLLKEMVFQTDVVLNYDLHHIISIRRQVNKNKPFEHHEISGMVESANWLDYPHETHGDEDIKQGSTSLVR